MVDGRPLRAARIRSVVDGWTAIVQVGARVDLTLTSDAMSAPAAAIALWLRPADRDIAVAVIAGRDGEPASLASIPMCECGERGCSHAGRQLRAELTSAQLGHLLDLLEPLTVSGTLGRNDALWQPTPE